MKKKCFEQLPLWPGEPRPDDALLRDRPSSFIDEIDAHWGQMFSFRDSVVAMFRVGSHSHGTYIPPEDPKGIDDVDIMAVVIPPKEHVLGLHRFEHAEVKRGNLDAVIYEWSKYGNMLLKANPNVVGTLWLRPIDMWVPQQNPAFSDLRSIDSPFRDLLQGRRFFASQKAHDSFVGYAKSQLYKMTHTAFQGYMGEKRKALVLKHGYDVKNAAHLIRLLRMGIEYIETGQMNVFRTDAEELKAIKRGEWSLAQVTEEADRLFARAAEAMKVTRLPTQPNWSRAESLIVDGYVNWWEQTGQI